MTDPTDSAGSAAPASDDPFEQFDNAPHGALASAANDDDPFAQFEVGEPTRTTATGAFLHAAERGVVPAAGGLAAAGAGAELGAAGGALVGGPVGAVVGGLGGGIAGMFGGAALADKAQNWALSKLPDSWREKIGLDDRTQQLEAQQHGTAAFLGGLAPYALTMSPVAGAARALPENATALQRIMANPVTARVFGGGVMGGMELGQEAVEGQSPDWTRVGIATGMGVILNRPNRIGEALTDLGAAPARRVLGRAEAPVAAPRPPTVADAGDAQVLGPGIDEAVFLGSHVQDDAAKMTAQEAVRTEKSLLDEPPKPDLNVIARRLDPETFSRFDELEAQRDTFRKWLTEQASPTDEMLSEAQVKRDALQAQLDAHIEAMKGYTGGPDARRMRAQIRDAQAQIDELNGRRQAFTEGQAQDTPEMGQVRQHLLAVDAEMRDLGRAKAAAYRRAADHVGEGSIENAPVAAPEGLEAPAETVAPPQAPEAPESVQQPPQATGEVTPAPPRPVDQQMAFIAQDIMDRLMRAGRPAQEAEATGKLLAARYATRAARFKGALGDAETLYRREAPDLRGPDGKLIPAPKPLEGGEAAPVAGKPEPVAPAPDAVEPALELNQAARGRIRFSEGRRPSISLTKDANASTFIHETGHQWLEDLMRDGDHEAAPDSVKDDAQTVRDWLKVDSAEDIKTRHHEKFARGFEQYMREGVAPSKELAGVFSKFRDWLLSIYQTLKGLGAPINDDIRGVFDRMLAENPERTVIAPELPAEPTLASLHEADAEHIGPHEAEPAADRIEAERTRAKQEPPRDIANEIQPIQAEIEAARQEQSGGAGENAGTENVGSGDGRGNVQSDRGGPAPEPAGGGVGEGHSPVGESGNAASPESGGIQSGNGGQPGSRDGASRLAPRPADSFGPDESKFLDRAGNIRVENLTTRQDVAEAIRDAAEANDDFIGDRRGVITDGQVMELADALGMTFEKLSARKIGQAFNAEQVVAARKLLIQSATKVAELMRKAATGTDEDVLAYAEAKDRHQMIQAQVAGITAEAGRALRAFRDISMTGETKATDQFIKQATGKTLFQLRREAELGAALDTPEQVSKLMMDTQKRGFGQMILEYWINGLISGPVTHTTYAIGNTILAIEKLGPETAAASLFGRIREALGGEAGRVRVGEIAAQVAGAKQGFAPALKASLDALQSGVTTLLPGEKPFGATIGQNAAQSTLPFQPGTEFAKSGVLDEAARLRDVMQSAFGIVRGARDGLLAGAALLKAGGVEGAPIIGARYSPLGSIPDIELRGVNVLPVGSVIRTPGRAIAAIHSFFRSMNYSMEKNALAYRAAADAGLTGPEFDAKVGQLRANPDEALMEQARARATDLTLMGQGSEFVRQLAKLTNTNVFGFPLLKFIDPFVHIAGNVIDQSLIQRTPVGILAPEIRADLMGRNGPAAQELAAGKMIAGTALAVITGSLAAEGLISGSGPTDPKEAAVWRLAGNQSHSVRIGDMWYDVHRLGPLGMLMGVAADFYEVAHAIGEDEADEVARRITHAFTQNILDESFMRGPAELMKALEDSDRYGASYVRNFLSSFVPFSVGMAQMARAGDPYSRQARTIVDAMKAKVPGLSETLLPRRDIWGEPMPSRTALISPYATAIWSQKVSNDPVNQAMLDLGISPGMPPRKIRNVDLTDEQYDDFARIAGRMSKMRLDVLVNSEVYSRLGNYGRHDIIEKVLKECREAARGVMMMKYPSIAADALQQKRDALNDDE